MEATITKDKKLSFSCVECGATLRIPVSGAGVTGPCPKCRKTITAPSLPTGEATKKPAQSPAARQLRQLRPKAKTPIKKSLASLSKPAPSTEPTTPTPAPEKTENAENPAVDDRLVSLRKPLTPDLKIGAKEPAVETYEEPVVHLDEEEKPAFGMAGVPSATPAKKEMASVTPPPWLLEGMAEEEPAKPAPEPEPVAEIKEPIEEAPDDTPAQDEEIVEDSVEEPDETPAAVEAIEPDDDFGEGETRPIKPWARLRPASAAHLMSRPPSAGASNTMPTLAAGESSKEGPPIEVLGKLSKSEGAIDFENIETSSQPKSLFNLRDSSGGKVASELAVGDEEEAETEEPVAFDKVDLDELAESLLSSDEIEEPVAAAGPMLDAEDLGDELYLENPEPEIAATPDPEVEPESDGTVLSAPIGLEMGADEADASDLLADSPDYEVAASVEIPEFGAQVESEEPAPVEAATETPAIYFEMDETLPATAAAPESEPEAVSEEPPKIKTSRIIPRKPKVEEALPPVPETAPIAIRPINFLEEPEIEESEDATLERPRSFFTPTSQQETDRAGERLPTLPDSDTSELTLIQLEQPKSSFGKEAPTVDYSEVEDVSEPSSDFEAALNAIEKIGTPEEEADEDDISPIEPFEVSAAEEATPVAEAEKEDDFFDLPVSMEPFRPFAESESEPETEIVDEFVPEPVVSEPVLEPETVVEEPAARISPLDRPILEETEVKEAPSEIVSPIVEALETPVEEPEISAADALGLTTVTPEELAKARAKTDEVYDEFSPESGYREPSRWWLKPLIIGAAALVVVGAIGLTAFAVLSNGSDDNDKGPSIVAKEPADVGDETNNGRVVPDKIAIERPATTEVFENSPSVAATPPTVEQFEMPEIPEFNPNLGTPPPAENPPETVAQAKPDPTGLAGIRSGGLASGPAADTPPRAATPEDDVLVLPDPFAMMSPPDPDQLAAIVAKKKRDAEAAAAANQSQENEIGLSIPASDWPADGEPTPPANLLGKKFDEDGQLIVETPQLTLDDSAPTTSVIASVGEPTIDEPAAETASDPANVPLLRPFKLTLPEEPESAAAEDVEANLVGGETTAPATPVVGQPNTTAIGDLSMPTTPSDGVLSSGTVRGDGLAADLPEPVVSELSPEARGLLAAPRQILDQFLAATTWEERIPLIYEGEAKRGEIGAFYSNHTVPVFELPDVEFSSLGGDPDTGKDYYVYDVRTRESPDFLPIVIRMSADGPRVDWHSFNEFYDRTFAEFIDKEQIGPATFRLRIKRSSYFGQPDGDTFTTKDEWVCFKISPPYVDYERYAFARKGTTVGDAMQEICYWGMDPELIGVFTIAKQTFPHGVDHLVITEINGIGLVPPKSGNFRQQ